MTGPGRPLYVTIPARTVWLRSTRRAMPRGYRLRGTRSRTALAGGHSRLVGGPSLGLLLRPLPFLRLAGADRGDALGDGDLEAFGRPRRVVEVGHRHAREALADRALDLAE